MTNINVVFFQYGDYLNFPIIQEIVKRNLEKIKPKSVTFLGMEDMQKICANSIHFKKFQNCGSYASDVARLLYLQDHPNTLYLDLDSYIADETFNFIKEAPHESYIAGYLSNDGRDIDACSGTFLYRGDNRSKFFDIMISLYEKTASENKMVCDIDIAKMAGLEICQFESPYLIGKAADTLILQPQYNFHLSASRFTRNLRMIKSEMLPIRFSFNEPTPNDNSQSSWIPLIIIVDPKQNIRFTSEIHNANIVFFEPCPEELIPKFVETLYYYFGNDKVSQYIGNNNTK